MHHSLSNKASVLEADTVFGTMSAGTIELQDMKKQIRRWQLAFEEKHGRKADAVDIQKEPAIKQLCKAYSLAKQQISNILPSTAKSDFVNRPAHLEASVNTGLHTAHPPASSRALKDCTSATQNAVFSHSEIRAKNELAAKVGSFFRSQAVARRNKHAEVNSTTTTEVHGQTSLPKEHFAMELSEEQKERIETQKQIAMERKEAFEAAKLKDAEAETKTEVCVHHTQISKEETTSARPTHTVKPRGISALLRAGSLAKFGMMSTPEVNRKHLDITCHEELTPFNTAVDLTCYEVLEPPSHWRSSLSSSNSKMSADVSNFGGLDASEFPEELAAMKRAVGLEEIPLPHVRGPNDDMTERSLKQAAT